VLGWWGRRSRPLRQECRQAHADWQAAIVDAEERAKAARLTRERMTILRAVDAAFSQYREVADAIAGSSDRSAAITAVSQLLKVDETSARAVTEFQWGRIRRDVHAQVTDELAQLARELEMLER
jgi:DNA gyrase/topoisomerase IV subunit A